MHELGVLERRAAVRVDDVDAIWVEAARFDIQDEAKTTQKGVLEVMLGARPLWYSFVEVGNFRWGERKRHWEAGLESIAIPDIADLRNVGLDKLETVALYQPTPLAQLFLDAASSRPYPLQLEVKDRSRVVYDVVMKYNALGLVAFLLWVDVNGHALTENEPFPLFCRRTPPRRTRSQLIRCDSRSEPALGSHLYGEVAT